MPDTLETPTAVSLTYADGTVVEVDPTRIYGVVWNDAAVGDHETGLPEGINVTGVRALVPPPGCYYGTDGKLHCS